MGGSEKSSRKRPPHGESVAGKKTKELSLEEALERLEEIARELEDGSLDLERSLQRYREARRLYSGCVARLSEAEREVRILMADGNLGPADQETDALGGQG